MKRLTRRKLLAATIMVGITASLGFAAPGFAAPPASSAATAQRPNFVFILVDDMGYADFSVTGNRRVSTPNVDRLAAEGLLMEQFTVAAPICSASRAAFLTGDFPARHRFLTFINNRAHHARTGQADWLDPKLPTIARTLQSAGYATGHFGKWHLGGGRDIGDAPLPAAYGFDESYTQFEGLGPRVLMTEDHYGLASKSEALGRGPIDHAPKSRTTAIYVDKLLDFAARHPGRPFYANLWPDDIHDPWEPSAEQLAAVKGKGRNEAEDRFFATLVAMDAEIGRLVEGLRRLGVLDNTVIILTGDNGPSGSKQYYAGGATAPGDAGPFRGRKGSLYEGGVREPLIVHWPGHVPAGRRDAKTIANAVDFFPTVAALAGVKDARRGDGIDISRAWLGAPIAKRPDLLYTHAAYGPPDETPRPSQPADRSPGFAVREGNWKLLARGDGANPELYDLANDPGERNNLASRHPAVVKRLTAKIVAFRKSIPLTPFYVAAAGKEQEPED